MRKALSKGPCLGLVSSRGSGPHQTPIRKITEAPGPRPKAPPPPRGQGHQRSTREGPGPPAGGPLSWAFPLFPVLLPADGRPSHGRGRFPPCGAGYRTHRASLRKDGPTGLLRLGGIPTGPLCLRPVDGQGGLLQECSG